MTSNDKRAGQPLGLVSLMLLAVAARPALAQDDAASDFETRAEFEMEFSAGFEYDTNVSVIDLDSNVGTGDTAIVARAEFDYQVELAPETELKAGYTFSDKSYQDFSDFDLQTHLASVTADREFGDFKAGAAYRYVNSRLGGDKFLIINQVSPFVARFFTKAVYVRADYTYSDKSFEGRIGRDGDEHSIGADVYYFLDGARRFVVLGYDFETFSADDDQFSYDGHALKARFSQRIRMGSRDTRLRLGIRYQTRDYEAPTPSINEPRDDDRLRLEVEFEYPLTDRYFVTAEYEYGDFASALPSADYDQSVIDVRFGAKF